MNRFAKKGRIFDLVIVDPPTFSQSKERGVFKIERDLPELISATASVVAPGGVLFLSNGGAIEALEAATGKALWHSEIGALSSPPETFLLDGKQHVLATGASGLSMFVLN